MRALKVLIVIMGVLLVLGFAILAVMVVRKFQGNESLHSSSPQTQNIVLTPGYKVESISDVAGQIVLHMKSPSHEDSLIIIDPHSGKVVSRIEPESMGKPAIQ